MNYYIVMPLVTCVDCGKEISAAAAACPNCGRPMRPVSLHEEGFGHKLLRVGCWLLIAAVVLLLVFIVLFWMVGHIQSSR